ncbi:nitrite reductase [Gordonia phthalatica]|uniref:Nitrite reductase n=1 Tax=Gordonia phthalatica TaxID=1136941 RepID=A0A0N7FV31_9ACTN|nr:nitrite reductase [Gordonia phthalatica]ALG86023.1 nitrite reductase [Gordonia phthalatica]
MEVSTPTRTRPDRCPGVLRPWAADDGALTRIRVPGGQVSVSSLLTLAEIADLHGDGLIHVTGRANLQLRALPAIDGSLIGPVVAAIEATGLLPSRNHDLARNILVSPQTGLAGGRADLRPVLADLDRRLLAEPRLAELPGRFLFVLDDGRSDLHDRHRDLGLIALDGANCQLRVGKTFGPVLPLDDAAATLVRLALRFLDHRGSGPTAAWHVAELPAPLCAACTPAPQSCVRTEPLPYGRVPGGHHVDALEGLTRSDIAGWGADRVVLTPWHGVLIPENS